VSIASDDDTDSSKLDGEYHSEHDSDVDICIAHDVDALDSIDVDGNVDMERGSDDQVEEEEEQDDEEKEDE
jgi:hypothetical protein